MKNTDKYVNTTAAKLIEARTILQMSIILRGSFAQPINFGHVLEITAKAHKYATSFHISLSNGKKFAQKSGVKDIALLLSADLKNNKIKLNHCFNNAWGKGMCKEFRTAIFKKEFRIYIVVAECKFHIAINNEAFEAYKCECRLTDMDCIEIEGNLDYIKRMDHRQYFPFTWPLIQIKDDFLDFSNDQPMSFQPGHLIIIAARLLGNDKGRFAIQLRNSRDHRRQEFYASFRFHAEEFVSNSKVVQQGDILAFDDDNAEIDVYLPYIDFSKQFRLAIAFTGIEVKVAKDGQCICDYAYRSANSLEDIVGVKIIGFDGVRVVVRSIDHLQLDDPHCIGYENYTKV